MIRVFVNIVVFYMILKFDFGNDIAHNTRMETRVVDVKPTLVQDFHHYRHGFVYNFLNLSHDNIPSYNFLALKNVTDYTLKDGNMSTFVLPTVNYQAIYFYVYEGSVSIHIEMCNGGLKLHGGHATRGWNLVALDFPTLLKRTHCRDFSMQFDRPILHIQGSSHFSLWKADQFYFMEVPVYSNTANIARQLLIIFGFLAVALAVIDNRMEKLKELEEEGDEAQKKFGCFYIDDGKMNDLPPSYESATRY